MTRKKDWETTGVGGVSCKNKSFYYQETCVDGLF